MAETKRNLRKRMIKKDKLDYTFFSYKNHVYKNVEAQISLKFKNVVVISLVAISISFRGSNKN